MATRSFISIKESDHYEGVYCHWDGYLEHNGVILLEHYRDPEKLRRLIELGDVSSLGEEIGKKHPFLDRPEGFTTFYGRDRGESGVQAKCFATLEDVFDWLEESGCEFLYVWDGFWQYASRGPQYFGMGDGTPFSELQPLWMGLSRAEPA